MEEQLLKGDPYRVVKYLNRLGSVQQYESRYWLDFQAKPAYDNDDMFMDKYPDPRASMEHIELGVDLWFAIKKLPPRQRQIVQLYMQGFGPAEISVMLKTTSGIVRYQKHLAKQFIAKTLDKP